MNRIQVRNIEDPEKLHEAFQGLTIALDGCGTPEQQEEWLTAEAAAMSASEKPIEVKAAA